MNQYILCFLVFCSVLVACKEQEPPLPELKSGYILISCDVGPYYLEIDSLQANCGSNEALPDSLIKSRLNSIYGGNLIVSNACSYDDNPAKLGSSSHHDLKLQRSQLDYNSLELYTAFRYTTIPMTLDGSVLNASEYPLLATFEIDLAPGTLRLYAINIWVGGCLHDMILWERREG